MRKRFCKSGKPFYQADADPGESLREIFLTFDLKDFHDEIVFWLELSLTNDRGAYQEGKDREDVMDFCHELIKLVDAFYMLSITGIRHKKHKTVISPSKRNIGGKETQLLLIDPEEIGTPDTIIIHFREMFSSSYVDLEMLDLLDSVITYEGIKQVNRQNLVLFYQCVRYFIASAYTFKKSTKN